MTEHFKNHKTADNDTEKKIRLNTETSETFVQIATYFNSDEPYVGPKL